MVYDKVVAYDLETTGLSRKTDKILEIGAVAYFCKTGELRTFSTLIDTGMEIDWRVSIITGIAKATYKEEESMDIRSAVHLFSEFFREDSRKVLCVGHNILSFDHHFINPILERERLPVLNKKHSYCTFQYFKEEVSSRRARMSPRRRKNYKQKLNLTAACEYYKVDMELPAHRALPDAINSLNVALKQIKINKSVKLARKQCKQDEGSTFRGTF